jgi:acyl-CoA synthetase (AMP-forming)/AMP-acid ligase II
MTGTMTDADLAHFTEAGFDFGRIWDNLERCSTKGINIWEDASRSVVFYPFSQLYAESGRVARRLARRGLVKGDIVLVSAVTEIRFVTAWLACVRLGIIPATIPPRAAFMTEAAYLGRITELLPYYRHFICWDSELTSVREALRVSGAELSLIPVGELYEEADESAPDEPPFRNNVPAFDDTAYVQFSSGSTGFPKGLMITYRNILTNLRTMRDRLEIDPELSCLSSWMPLYHDMGFINLLLSIFSQTNLLIVQTYFFLKRMFDFLRMIDTYRADFLCMTNSMLEVVLQRYSEDKCEGLNLGSLRWVGVGAEPISLAAVRRFQETFARYGLRENALSPCYGLAESTLCVTMSRPFEPFETVELGGYPYPTVGRPLEGTSIAFRNTGDTPDDRGVIRVKSDSVARYALVRGRKMKITDDEEYYDTGDIGCMYGDRLVIAGRIDTMFIVGGVNRFPHEVESALIGSGLLPRPSAVCLTIPAERSALGRLELVAVYEVNRISAEEKAALDERLGSAVLAATGLRIDTFVAAKRGEILYTTSGKFRYIEMRERYSEGKLRNCFEDQV